ncbi:hypothetical protein B0H13DRAFT_2496531 [Mycena leptocephala]|nr:hypothetical protein B0H13DRAFT_2496531 [Mycena leptocephala]
MTDYASQGKGRDENVVHLNNSKNHHNYYVALSRGYTADGTCIIQGFDSKKITSGISGHLRQEFRELELLDEITKLCHEGHLPRRVTGIYRGKLLASYKAWKGNAADLPHFHPAIRAGPGDKEPLTDYSAWKPTIQKPTAKKGLQNNEKQGNMKTANATCAIPVSGRSHLDSTNYSCAYDALFTSLACVWAENPELWSQRLIDCNPLLGIWATAMAQNSLEPERARNVVRMRLHSQNAADFPLGPRGVKLDALFMAVAEGRTYGLAKPTAKDVELNFPHRNGVTTLKLRGLIYHSQMEGHSIGHFTSVVVDAEGIMWYHDGITTKRTCINNGRFADVANPLTLHQRHGQRLSAAIYALQ